MKRGKAAALESNVSRAEIDLTPRETNVTLFKSNFAAGKSDLRNLTGRYNE
ncbi:hypothetical protein [Alkalicoccus luteus]|uniref:Uncharacterized protein n=1 Tax=Alkalicoccus luteus TaxID=1237094 RepID=A0A969PL71_9BACI|nr:hypothetical protein [Alkalicoccus luteus]NJP36230.1 hypothetical protein [Alkalicoccus luteus]